MSNPYNPSNPYATAPAPEAPANEFAITAWAQAAQRPSVQVIELPSGQKVKAKPLEMVDIIEMNLLAELDTFSGFFSDGDEAEPEDDPTGLKFMSRIAGEGKFSKFMETMDKVIMKGTIAPQIVASIDDPEVVQQAIASGCVPVNILPFTDKMAIFGVVFEGMGGMADFRPGQGEGVVPVEAEPGASVPTI